MTFSYLSPSLSSSCAFLCPFHGTIIFISLYLFLISTMPTCAASIFNTNSSISNINSFISISTETNNVAVSTIKKNDDHNSICTVSGTTNKLDIHISPCGFPSACPLCKPHGSMPAPTPSPSLSRPLTLLHNFAAFGTRFKAPSNHILSPPRWS